MSNVQLRKIGRLKFGLQYFWVLLLIAFASCKSTEEKNAGTYTIVKYSFQGNDSLPQLSRNFLDGEFTLMEDLTFNSLKHTGIAYQLGDSIVYFSGHYKYPDSMKKIEFLADGITSISVFNGRTYNIIYFSNSHAGSFQPPLFYEGIWKIKKEGKQSLLLEADGDKNTEMELRRVNSQ